MDSVPPSTGTTLAPRTLAAILFTDAVSFSARMQRDEWATMLQLQRDFAEMRRLCTEHGGSVLKTTGDGLLLTFPSAVHAVACALTMQRQFADEAKGVAEGMDPMKHRIGIHLGDILVQERDVMGDGVNIAARLQAEAEPGGICISQMVYDVVKNKLEMNVVSLGALDLKNITHAMPVYRVLLDAMDPGLPAVVSRFKPSGAPIAPGKSNTRLWVLSGIAAVTAAMAGFVWTAHIRSGGSNPMASAVSPAPIQLKNSVVNVPVGTFKSNTTKSYVLSLPYEGTLTIDVRVNAGGNNLDIKLLAAGDREGIAGFEAIKAVAYLRSERLPAGNYTLELTDSVPRIPIISWFSRVKSTDVSILAKLEP